MQTLDVRALTERAADDPWSLDRDERAALSRAQAQQQERWRALLARVLGTDPGNDFPGFLLGFPQYTLLAERLESSHLDRPTLDLLDRFVEHFRNWGQCASAAYPAGPLAGEPLDSANDD